MVCRPEYTSYYITTQDLFENYFVIEIGKCGRYRGKPNLEIQF